MRKHRRLFPGAIWLLVFAFVAVACNGGSGGGGNQTPTGGTEGLCAEEQDRGDITVGVSGAFPESQIVAEIYAQLLEHCGYTVERSLELDTRQISSTALEEGDIDIKPEYVAFELVFQDPDDDGKGSVDEVTDRLRTVLAPKGISVLEPSEANDTNAFVVTQETSDELGVTTMSELADHAGDLLLGAPAECSENFFCAVGLREVYGIEFKRIVDLDACGPLSATALDTAEVDVALLCSTQAIIADKGWVALEDDKGLQQAGNIVPLVRDDALNDEIEGILNAVSAALDTEKITGLNAEAELGQEDPEQVAADFIEEEGLAD
jgi:osmoprotectant transport system substrate-binding protein